MGKKNKVGKARKDKFYFLAKETGFRSRSAFKLIQLNRRFGFLNTSKVLVDLCAAPGGWLQVAAKEMPITSEIIGVDLVPIQSIPRVKTFVVDITKEKCKQLILQTLGTQKADVVLHDGSPNVGTAWSIDEFSQANLCLQAFALASEVLRKGGWFITKVFRSRDYEPLKWVISQFFRTLRAVKPEASRIESAEIFLVGQFYLAPDNIDPKFLDVRYVFGEVEEVPDRAAVISTLFKENKKKKKAEGYAEGDSLYHELKVSDFLNASDPLHSLANANKIIFDLPSILNNPLTTDIIKEDVKDIQVLGKGDIRQILKWRRKLVDELTPKPEPVSKMETDDANKVVDEDEEIETEVQRLIHEEEKETKKRLKRVRKAKIKLAERLVLKMEHPDDHIEQHDDELFNLSSLQNIASLEKAGLLVGDTSQTGVDELARRVEKESLESARRALAEQRRSAVEGGKRVHFERRDDTGDWDYDENTMATSKGGQTGRDDLYLSDDNDDSSTDAEDDFASDVSSEAGGAPSDTGEDDVHHQSSKAVAIGNGDYASSVAPKSDADEALSHLLSRSKQNPLLVDLDETDEHVKEKDKIKYWMQSAEIRDLLAEKDDDDDEDDGGSTGTEESSDEAEGTAGSGVPRGTAPLPKATGVLTRPGQQPKAQAKPTANPDGAASAGAEAAPTGGTSSDGGKRKNGARRLKRPLSVEEQALALRLIRSAKSRRELIEDGYHRGRFFEDPSQLPDWFVEDERRHMHRPQLVRKEELEAVDPGQPVQGRTLKKAEEAKARKRQRLARRMQRLRARVEKIPDEISETEKWDQIKNMYKKAGMVKAKRRPLHVIVNTKGGARNQTKKAPKGAKVKIVDRRMKADLRANERVSGRGKKSGGRGGSARRPVKLRAHKPRNGGRRQRHKS